MKIIPAIDIKDGKCVRLFKGDFDKTTEYSADPTSIGHRFSSLDVRDLHIVDLDGARDGVSGNASIVAAIAEKTGLDVQVGGGIRERRDVSKWLDAGVKRCVVGSVAIEQPDEVCSWIDEYGADCVVLALDVRIDGTGTPILATHGWTKDSGVSLWSCLERYPAAIHVLCTDVGRDGAMAGPNLALYEQVRRRFPALQLQASGGVRHVDDLNQLRALGCPAAITGRALLDGQITATEIASFRQSA